MAKTSNKKLADTIFAEAMRANGLSTHHVNLALRSNPGVTALALALPNPAGEGSFPPDIAAIRRSEEAMGKRKNLSPAAEAALAYGREVRANMLRANAEERDNISQTTALRQIAKAQAAAAADALADSQKKDPSKRRKTKIEPDVFQGGAGLEGMDGAKEKLKKLISRNEKIAKRLEAKAAQLEQLGGPGGLQAAAYTRASAQHKLQPYVRHTALPGRRAEKRPDGRVVLVYDDKAEKIPTFSVRLPTSVQQQIALGEFKPGQSFPVEIVDRSDAALSKRLTDDARAIFGEQILIRDPSVGPDGKKRRLAPGVAPKGSVAYPTRKLVWVKGPDGNPTGAHTFSPILDEIVAPEDIVVVQRTRTGVQRIGQDERDLVSIDKVKDMIKVEREKVAKTLNAMKAELAKPKDQRPKDGRLPGTPYKAKVKEWSNPMSGKAEAEATGWLEGKGKGVRAKFAERLGLPKDASAAAIAARLVAAPAKGGGEVVDKVAKGPKISQSASRMLEAKLREIDLWAGAGAAPRGSLSRLAGLPGMSHVRKAFKAATKMPTIVDFRKLIKDTPALASFYGTGPEEDEAKVRALMAAYKAKYFQALGEGEIAPAVALRANRSRANQLRANGWMDGSMSLAGVQADLMAGGAKGYGLAALAGLGGFVANTIASNVVHGMVGEKAGQYVRFGVPALLSVGLYKGWLGADRLSQGQRAFAIGGIVLGTFMHDTVRGWLTGLPVIGALIGRALNVGAKGMSGLGEDDPFDAAFDDDLSGMGQIYAESGAAGVGDSDLRYVRERGTNGLGLYVAEQGAQAPGASMEGMGQLYAVSVDGLGEDAPPGTVPITRSEPEPSELPEFSQQNISMLTSRGVFGDPVFDSAYNPFSGVAAPALPEQGD